MSRASRRPAYWGGIICAALSILFVQAVAKAAEPALSPPANSSPPLITIMVDRADPPFALWDGLPIPDAAGLDQKLAVYAAEFGRPMIHLVPTREATYQHVAEVMKILQRYGANIGLVGNEQFLPASPPTAEPKR